MPDSTPCLWILVGYFWHERALEIFTHEGRVFSRVTSGLLVQKEVPAVMQPTATTVASPSGSMEIEGEKNITRIHSSPVKRVE